MARGIPIRDDYDGEDLRALALSTGDAKQARRLLALSLIYDGGTRSEAARHGDVSLQTVRELGLAFQRRGPGRPGRWQIDGYATASEGGAAGSPVAWWRTGRRPMSVAWCVGG